MDFERLFSRDRPVPGMRPTGRVTHGSNVTDIEATPEGVVGSMDSPARESAQVIEDDAGPETFEHEAIGRETIERETIERETVESDVSDGELGERAEETSAPEFPLAVLEPGRPGPQLLSAHDPAHSHSERIRLLRTEILLRHAAQNESMAFAVVGAGAGEGRSRLAAEIALAFAQLGSSTLLLDADLRHPKQHELFGVELRDGLAQAISSGESPTYYRIEGYPTMSLVTAGVSASNPMELLSDGRFESLMYELRHNFEFIIVDTPRCSDFADGLVIATVVGHVLTVHRAKFTPYKDARAMLRQLISARADILGGVLNHF